MDARQCETVVKPWGRGPNRRRVLRGLLGSSLAGIAGVSQLFEAPARATTCGSEPGVVVLEQLTRADPSLAFADLVTPPDWVLHPNPDQSVPSYLYPSTWTPLTWWASDFSPQWAPRWSGQPPFPFFLMTVRVVSPEGTALFEEAGGFIPVTLRPLQAAFVAERGVVGDGATLTTICEYESYSGPSAEWLRAVAWGESVLTTHGFTNFDPDGFFPGVGVGYYSMLGPREQYEQLMREVFVRILFQLNRNPEPVYYTPTPDPG